MPSESNPAKTDKGLLGTLLSLFDVPIPSDTDGQALAIRN